MRLFLFALALPIFSYEIALASMFHNTAGTIREWVYYHHMIGVDHFWLYDDSSSDQWRDALFDFIEKGIVEVIPWKVTKPDWRDDQIAAYKDGMRRAQQTKTKWFALLDQDEFFLPMKDKSLKACLKNRFSEAKGIYVNWLCFGTNHQHIAPGSPILTKLTACIKPDAKINNTCKAILQPMYGEIDAIWHTHFCPLQKGKRYVDGDNKKTVKSGHDLKSDGNIHTKYLRINHYAHGDENYFWNVRMKRMHTFVGKKGESRENVLLRHYREFNTSTNHDMVNFLKNHYRKQYKQMWRKS